MDSRVPASTMTSSSSSRPLPPLSRTLFPLVLLVLLSCLAPLAAAQDLVASLDYGTFQGAYSTTYNISYWQKIPFAQPPVGALRFRGPQPPLAQARGAAVYDSTQPFDMCPQRTTNGSEDCLYLGLYARPWTAGQPLRPALVVFYGGAYIQGDASFGLPPSALPVLNVSAATDLVVVYANYRTNAFGFLPGREVAADTEGSDLNPGLLDQDAAIKCGWIFLSVFFILALLVGAANSFLPETTVVGTSQGEYACPSERDHSQIRFPLHKPRGKKKEKTSLTLQPRDQEVHIPLRRRPRLHLHLGPVRRRRLRRRPGHRARGPA